MPAPFQNLRSKLNRAICAYLLTFEDTGTAQDISPGNSQSKNVYPLTIVHSTIARPNPPLTGIYQITVHISVKGSATQTNGEPNPEFARVQFDQRLAATYDAMMQSDDNQSLLATAKGISAAGRALAVDASNGADANQVQFAANNADMVDFTCEAVYDGGFGDGKPDEEGCSWVEILIFDCLCASINCD
jgi:hypothetical protein